MKSGRGHIYPFRAFNDENPLTKNPPTWRFLGSRKNALPDSFFFPVSLRVISDAINIFLVISGNGSMGPPLIGGLVVQSVAENNEVMNS